MMMGRSPAKCAACLGNEASLANMLCQWRNVRAMRWTGGYSIEQCLVVWEKRILLSRWKIGNFFSNAREEISYLQAVM